MKFYVAGPAGEIETCQKIVGLVREAGHEITFDWTHHKDDGGEGDVRNSWDVDDTTREEARIYASKERQGVKDSDILVFWLPRQRLSARIGGKGCFWEAGIASYEDEKEIWLLNKKEHNADLVFYHLPNCREMDMATFKLTLDLMKAAEIEDMEERRRETDRIAESYKDYDHKVYTGAIKDPLG